MEKTNNAVLSNHLNEHFCSLCNTPIYCATQELSYDSNMGHMA